MALRERGPHYERHFGRGMSRGGIKELQRVWLGQLNRRRKVLIDELGKVGRAYIKERALNMKLRSLYSTLTTISNSLGAFCLFLRILRLFIMEVNTVKAC